MRAGIVAPNFFHRIRTRGYNVRFLFLIRNVNFFFARMATCKFASMLSARSSIVILGCVVAACSSSEAPSPNNPNPTPDPVVPYADFMRAADLSFLPEIEGEGTVFLSNNDTPSDVIVLLRSRGCNAIRVRLWHTPADVHSSLDEVEDLVERIRTAGMKVYISLHYSDTWADPGNQTMPLAWNGLSFTDLKDSVYLYTKKVMTRLQPEYVQIGNEINGGMLWEAGRISNLGSFFALVKEGCKAVREIKADAKIMLHFAGTQNADWFFTQAKNQNVDYDLIGLSYYPVWHGTSLDVLKSSINALITVTSKPVVLAEIAYPFTLGWNDNTNNIVGQSDQLVPGYPATPEGQKDYLLAIKTMLKQNSKGAGFCYWGAEWVAFRGVSATDGSAAENQALFSFNIFKELPATAAFAE